MPLTENQINKKENLSSGKTEAGPKIGSVITLLQRSWETYKSNFWRFIVILLIPPLGGLPLAVVLVLNGILTYLNNGSIIITFFKFILVLAGIMCIALWVVAAVIAQAGIFVLIKNAARRPTLKETYNESKRVAWDFFIVNLVAGIVVLLWMLLFLIPLFAVAVLRSLIVWTPPFYDIIELTLLWVIPGLAAVYYILVSWVLLYEGTGGLGALKRSRRLVRGHWWAVAGRVVFLQLAVYIILIIPALFVRSALFLNIWGITTKVIAFVLAPLFLAYTCHIYEDLKKIKGE